MLTAADLVTADATAYSSHPGTPHAPGKAASSSGGSSLARQLSGYLCIRTAFAGAFDELLLQPAPAPDQVHELWAALQDYLDRTVARADVALSAAEQLRAEKEQVGFCLLHDPLHAL